MKRWIRRGIWLFGHVELINPSEENDYVRMAIFSSQEIEEYNVKVVKDEQAESCSNSE
jgi:hypothetical protein